MARLTGLIALLLLIVSFVAANIAADGAIGGARLDLTQGRVYSLTEAGARIARAPETTVTLRYYFSETLLRDEPALLQAGRRVERLLRAFEQRSGGRVRLIKIDPEPFSDEEQEAIAEGMTPIPARVAGEPAFMGLVGTNEIDGKEFIPLFQGGPDAERFREYEIARAIASLSRVDKPVVGLMSPLPIAGTPANPVSGQGERPRWEILTRIIDSFRVLLVPTVGTQEIDPQVDVLLVIHPRDLDDQALYRLEQFILGGGRAVILTDTYYLRGAAQARASQVTSVLNRDFDSTLGPVFDAWGLVFDTDETASDEARAAVLPQSSERGTIEVPHVHIIRLFGDQLAQDDPATRNLGGLVYGIGGHFETAEDAPVEVTPLLRTTTESMRLQTLRVKFSPAQQLAENFTSGGEELTLAARVTGEVETAFADGIGGLPLPDGHLERSAGPINVVVIGDVDMVSDDLWLQRQTGPSGEPAGYRVISDNASFLLNTLEQITGSEDLLTLRARGSATRPLEKIVDMEREADLAQREQAAAFQEELAEIEARINELTAGIAPGDVLPTELEEEALRFRAERSATVASLRDIERESRADLERVKLQYQLINTAMVPALLCVVAVSLGAYRAARRRADRRRGQGR